MKAGQPLSDGTIPAQDILNILGPYAVQSYLVNEIQEVYRLQGVKINDKHVEVIVSTMMQKVEITDPGDTLFLEGDKVDRFEMNVRNDELIGKFVITDEGGSDLKKGTILDRREVRDINNTLIKEELKTTREAEPSHLETNSSWNYACRSFNRELVICGILPGNYQSAYSSFNRSQERLLAWSKRKCSCWP